MKGKLPRSWRAIAWIYREFAEFDSSMDWSSEAAVRMYEYESLGVKHVDCFPAGLFTLANKLNGYAYGKHAMDVMIAMYKEDIRNHLLTKHELCTWWPKWWVKSVFRKVVPEESKGWVNLVRRHVIAGTGVGRTPTAPR